MNAQQVGTDKRDGNTFYQFQPTVSNTKSQKRLQSFLAANQTEVLVWPYICAKKVKGTFWHWSILCFVWFVAILFANKQLILAKNPNSINFALKVCLKDFLLLQEWVAISGEEVIIPTALSIPTIFENFRQEVGLNWLLSAFFLKFNNKIKVYVMSQ